MLQNVISTDIMDRQKDRRNGSFMRYVSIDNIKPGMKLSQPIRDNSGRMLLGENCILTGAYMNKLLEYGFEGIYIDDEWSKGVDVKPIISTHLKDSAMECVQKLDVDACIEVARDIVDEILNKGSFALDMTDLRTYDNYTYAHSVNVAVVSCIIGMGSKMSEKDLEGLVLAGLLHDLGKLKVPGEILNKKGRLTPEEFAIMKGHAQMSYDLLADRWEISTFVKTAVKYHHENIDGSGYPDGIKGDLHTSYIKILHVADVYDALISKRPYKKPFSPHEVVEYMMGNCGTLFDKQTVDVLLKYVSLYPKGTEVNLSDGRVALVVENSGEHNLRPIVRLKDGEEIDLFRNLSLTITDPRDNDEEIMKAEMERFKMIEDAKKVK